MLLRRVIGSVLAIFAVVFAATGCGGGSSSTTSPPTTIRRIYGQQSVHCLQGQVVEQGPNYVYHCVSRNPALPVSASSQVQQGDPCPTFGATTFNAQGKPFDCEPWADGVNRWILP